MQMVTLAAGCFWCTEAIYQSIPGIYSLKSGYSGGHEHNPSYQSVCSEKSGHAETIQFSFDQNIISYDQIIHLFWRCHDPTSLNRQGHDIGSRYRSAIFYHDQHQKSIAFQSMKQYQKSCSKTIVTQITPFSNFYPAEDDHQNYFQNNPHTPYCQFIIKPKLQKFLSFNDGKNISHL